MLCHIWLLIHFVLLNNSQTVFGVIMSCGGWLYFHFQICNLQFEQVWLIWISVWMNVGSQGLEFREDVHQQTYLHCVHLDWQLHQQTQEALQSDHQGLFQ